LGDPPPLLYASGEPAMAGDEPSLAADAGTAIPAIPIETGTHYEYEEYRSKTHLRPIWA